MAQEIWRQRRGEPILRRFPGRLRRLPLERAGPVGIGRGHRRQRQAFVPHALIVRSLQVLEEDSPGEPIDRDVMHDEDQQRRQVGASFDQRHTGQRPARQAEAAV